MSLTHDLSTAQFQKFFHSNGTELELWLKIICGRISASSGEVYDGETGELVAHVGVQGGSKSAPLESALILQVAASGQGTLVEGEGVVALYPVCFEERCQAVVALFFNSVSKESLADVLMEIQWSSAWLALQEYRENAGKLTSQLTNSALLLEVVAEGLAEKTFSQSIGALLHKLSELFNADRVYLGAVVRGKARILQATGFTQPKQRTESVRMLEAAMFESFDQKQIVAAPSEQKRVISRAHAHIISSKGVSAVASLPLKNNKGDSRFVLLLERDVGNEFSQSELEVLDALGVYLAPLVELKDRDNQSLVSLFVGRFFGRFKGLVKPAFFVVAAAAAVYSSVVVRVPLMINGDAILQTTDIQAVIAPFAGYIERVEVVPGDRIVKGQPLVKLESRDLELELIKIRSELVRLENTLQEAVGSFDRKKQRSTESEIQIKRSELSVLKSKISRTLLVAPFDGVVLEGDLRQRVGGQLAVGELLMTLAPQDSFHIQVRVPEHEITHIALGTSGSLYLNAIPHSSWDLQVDRIFPATTVDENGAAFLVEADIDQDSDLLKSGLRGVAKFDVGETSLLNRLTRDWQHWARTKWWSIWG